MTDQPQMPEQQDTARQELVPPGAAGEPEAPVAPPPPTVPLESSDVAPAAPSTAVAAPAPGGQVAAVDGSPAGGVADEHPEILAGAAFAGGFLLALILKRLGT